MFRSYFYALFFFLFASLAVEGATVLTNAERIARGLPISEPKGFVRKEFNGVTRTIPQVKKNAARWPKPSASPVPQVSGVIQVTKADGSIFYVGKKLSNEGFYEKATDEHDALVVTLPSSTSGTFGLTTSDTAGFPFVGFFVGPDSWCSGTLAPGSSQYVVLGGLASETPAGSLPERVGNTNKSQWAESDLWTFLDGEKLCATWVNESGAAAKTNVLFYSEEGNYFGVTGDLDAYNGAKADAQGVAVTLHFVKI